VKIHWRVQHARYLLTCWSWRRTLKPPRIYTILERLKSEYHWSSKDIFIWTASLCTQLSRFIAHDKFTFSLAKKYRQFYTQLLQLDVGPDECHMLVHSAPTLILIVSQQLAWTMILFERFKIELFQRAKDVFSTGMCERIRKFRFYDLQRLSHHRKYAKLTTYRGLFGRHWLLSNWKSLLPTN
jgi:hypothetical protein